MASDRLRFPAVVPSSSAPELIGNSASAAVGARPKLNVSKVKLSPQNVLPAAVIAGSSKSLPISTFIPKTENRHIQNSTQNAVQNKAQQQQRIPLSLSVSQMSQPQPSTSQKNHYPLSVASRKPTVRFSESVCEDLPQKMSLKNSTQSFRSEIPSEVLSQMGLVFISGIKNITSSSSSHAEVSSSPSTTTATFSQEATRNVVIFRWPLSNNKYHKKRNPIVKALISSHGMFFTLFSLLHDVTGSHPIVSNIRVGDETVEVAYTNDNDGQNLLIFGLQIATKEKVLRLSSASQVLNHLKDVIHFRWGSFERAFTTESEETLDRILNNTLITLTNPKHFLFVKEPSILRLTSDVKQELDEELFEFESTIFYSEEEIEGSFATRPEHMYNCIGSVLFHKDKLLMSHLGVELQQQIYSLFMTEFNMWREDRKWESLKETVITSRAFLPKPCQINSHIVGSGASTSKYSETNKDCVAILTCHSHLLLGFVLEPIVKQNGFIQENCILWIHKALGILKYLAEQDYIIKINQNEEQEQPVFSHQSYLATSSAGQKNRFSQEFLFFYNITKGNALYHVIHLEFGHGLVLNSPDLSHDVFHSQLMENFQASARVTHGILQRAAKSRIGIGDNTDQKKWLSHSLAPISEHGSLFQCQVPQTATIKKKGKKHKEKIKMFSYWVIGRLYGDSKEIFVCYEDGKTPENMVESAFKLAHSICI